MRRPADNPFRASAIESLAFRASDTDTAALMRKLACNGHAGAIVGPHGSGKTTLLAELAVAYGAAGRDIVEQRLNARARRIEPRVWHAIDRGCVALLDSAGWLRTADRWRLRRAVRRGAAIVVTAHRRSFVPTLIETQVSPEVLQGLLCELVGSEAEAWRPAAHDAFVRHRGNVRAVWRELYDRWITRPPAGRRA